MPGLPWCRMDTGLPTHPKMLALIHDPSPRRWQAAAVVQFAIEWAAGQGTNGHIPILALPFIHASKQIAELLVKHGFWAVDDAEGGWRIHNFGVRQELAETTEAKRAQQSAGGTKGNCRRWHGPDCWSGGRCSRDSPD